MGESMLKLLTLLVALFIFGPATDAVVAQEALMQKTARHVRVPNQEAVVYPNVRLHPTAARNQSEMSITTHPLNPNIAFAGWNSGVL